MFRNTWLVSSYIICLDSKDWRDSSKRIRIVVSTTFLKLSSSGWAVETYVVDGRRYLLYLMNQFHSNGGTLQRGRVCSLSQVNSELDGVLTLELSSHLLEIPYDAYYSDKSNSVWPSSIQSKVL